MARPGAAGDPVERVGRAIRAQGPCLIVLDNFEQAISHGAATVGRWVREASEARFLVTSRERLRLAAEVA